jgi:hypothetical protein
MRTNVSTRIVLLVCLLLLTCCVNTFAIGQQKYVFDTFDSNSGSFPLAHKGHIATLCVDLNDWPGVIRAVNDLAADINRVSGQLPKITQE